MFSDSPTPHYCHNCGSSLLYAEARHVCSTKTTLPNKIWYGIREDNGAKARWLVEFQIRGLNLLQFCDINQGARIVLFENNESAARYIASDPSLSSAVIVPCTIVDDELIIHT